MVVVDGMARVAMVAMFAMMVRHWTELKKISHFFFEATNFFFSRDPFGLFGEQQQQQQPP